MNFGNAQEHNNDHSINHCVNDDVASHNSEVNTAVQRHENSDQSDVENLERSTQEPTLADLMVLPQHWYNDQQLLQKQATLAYDIANREWKMFHKVNNEGGPAQCQNNKPMFMIMRLSQAMTWPIQLLQLYAQDITNAEIQGRNLLEEKYAWMMQSTEPAYFHQQLAPHLQPINHERHTVQEQIIALQVGMAEQFAVLYPHLAHNMRTIHTKDDTADNVSFETYLRGEISTYSDMTLSAYLQYVLDCTQHDVNITEITIANTAQLQHFHDITEAEEYLH